MTAMWRLDQNELLAHAPGGAHLRSAPAHCEVEVRLSLVDREDTTWRVSNSTRTSAEGSLDLEEVGKGDLRGLPWLMSQLRPDTLDLEAYQRKSRGVAGRLVWDDASALPMRLGAYVDGAAIAEIEADLHRVASSVLVENVADGGVCGVLYQPSGKPRGAFVTIPGSNGGVDTLYAPALASAGFVVLALGLFAYPGRPDFHENLPLEYVKQAALFLSKLGGAGAPILLGSSRGAEAAILTTLHFPEVVAGAVGIVPGSVITPGWSPTALNATPPWTLNGQALPYAAGRLDELPDPADPVNAQGKGETFAVAPFYEEIFRSSQIARIDLSRLKRPVHLIGAGDDRIWPSALACSQLARTAPEGLVSLEILEGAGHFLSPPGAPTLLSDRVFHRVERYFYQLGGDPLSNARAALRHWRSIDGVSKQMLPI